MQVSTSPIQLKKTNLGSGPIRTKRPTSEINSFKSPIKAVKQVSSKEMLKDTSFMEKVEFKDPEKIYQ